MSVEPEGWHMEASPPSWDPEAKTFSFFLHKPGHERVLCILAPWVSVRGRGGECGSVGRPFRARAGSNI